MDYSDYTALTVSVQNGIASVALPKIGHDHDLRARLHREIGTIWSHIDRDDQARSVLLTGTGDEFYYSGDPESHTRQVLRAANIDQTWALSQQMAHEVNAIVYGMVNFAKPVVAAINGTTSGAGLAVALLSDLTVASEYAVIYDPHTTLGVAAGDGAAIILPLLCGMAKAKRYLLTSEPLTGAEAERIGLVSHVVDDQQVVPAARKYAQQLAEAPQVPVQLTKRMLNQWLRLGGIVSFDYSAALQSLTFFGPDVRTSSGWTAPDD